MPLLGGLGQGLGQRRMDEERLNDVVDLEVGGDGQGQHRDELGR